MLEIKKLRTKIAGKEILKGVNLSIPAGKTYILFGPNGSGKTSLLMSILGFPKYITTGKILFKNKDVLKFSLEKRVKMGMGIFFQRPPTVDGLFLKDFVNHYSRTGEKDLIKLAMRLKITDLLDRELNKGLSGGEIKKTELFQVLAQNPDLVLVDEPESGVDVENIKIVGKTLARFLKLKGKSALIITHSGAILKYINADKGFVMIDGKIACSGDAKSIFKTIQRLGYKKCIKCHKKHPVSN